MNEANLEFDLNEEEVFTSELSDEALEAAACAGPGNMAFSVAMCTGQAECPF